MISTIILGTFFPLSFQDLPFRLGSVYPLRCSQTVMPTAKVFEAVAPFPRLYSSQLIATDLEHLDMQGCAEGKELLKEAEKNS